MLLAKLEQDEQIKLKEKIEEEEKQKYLALHEKYSYLRAQGATLAIEGLVSQSAPDLREFIRGYNKETKEIITKDEAGQTYAMDSFSDISQIAPSQGYVNPLLTNWYASQTALPYAMCDLISQNPLISKIIKMPVQDSLRNGFELSINTSDGAAPPEILEKIKKLNNKYNLDKNLLEFGTFGRTHGVRICIFLVNSPDPDFYEKPLDLSSIPGGSFAGMTQVDPQWVTPQLSGTAVSDPSAKDFYEPTWWAVQSQTMGRSKGITMVHRSHIQIFRYREVGDSLKPVYRFGGISLPQLLYERVYAADRVANEAPQMAIAKRLLIFKMDMQAAITNEGLIKQKLDFLQKAMNNYGIQAINNDEEMSQVSSDLNDFEALIMTQYQLSCAYGNAPVTKILGTTPKGFQSTGEFEMKNYHEALESDQSEHYKPFIKKYMEYVIVSDINPMLPEDKKISIYDIDVNFNPMDSPTELEQAQIGKTRAEEILTLLQGFVIDQKEARQRLATDEDSGFNGIDVDAIVPESGQGDDNFNMGDPNVEKNLSAEEAKTEEEN